MFIRKISKVFNRIFSRLESIVAKAHFNVFQTVYLNFRLLPFSQAVKLPIFVYGRLNIQTLAGRCEIFSSAIKKGMITVGCNRDWFYPSKIRGLWSIPLGTSLVFKGPCTIGNGCTIRMSGKGILTIEENVCITSHVKICCDESIVIGKWSVITFNCQIRDTNFHYFLDTVKCSIPSRRGPIVVGAANWVGNNSVITKGTVTPAYTLTAAGSLLNKNYVILNGGIDESLFLVGIPARIKGKGLKLIYNIGHEREIDNFFYRHPEANYMAGDGFDYDIKDL